MHNESNVSPYSNSTIVSLRASCFFQLKIFTNYTVCLINIRIADLPSPPTFLSLIVVKQKFVCCVTAEFLPVHLPYSNNVSVSIHLLDSIILSHSSRWSPGHYYLEGTWETYPRKNQFTVSCSSATVNYHFLLFPYLSPSLPYLPFFLSN